MKNATYMAAGLLATCLLLLPACDWFKKMPLATKEPSLRLLDINTTAVYNDAHIPGAMHVSLNSIEDQASTWDKKTPIVTYCSDYNCIASHKAADTLRELGFSDVRVYSGGIHEWYTLSKGNKEQYPLEGPAKMTFLEKDVERLDPNKEDEYGITAEELAQRIQKN